MSWVSTAIGAGTAIYGAVNSKNAANKNASAVSNLQYQPIDLKALQEQARTAAEENAKKSIALEQQLQPDLAAARSGSQKMIAEDLKSGGQLPTDVANAVTGSSITGADRAGLYGGAGPITAANLGLTSLGLRDARLARATQLAQANPLPTAGLDPGALAGLDVAQNNALNQFNLSKVGAGGKANQATADANAGLITTVGGIGSDVLRNLNKKPSG